MSRTRRRSVDAPYDGLVGGVPYLDIGGDVGAVVVTLDATTSQDELEACRRGDPERRFHTGVHRWEAGDARVAVFPQVEVGDYSLLTRSGEEHTPFTVAGGEVTFVDQRGSVRR